MSKMPKIDEGISRKFAKLNAQKKMIDKCKEEINEAYIHLYKARLEQEGIVFSAVGKRAAEMAHFIESSNRILSKLNAGISIFPDFDMCRRTLAEFMLDRAKIETGDEDE